MGNIFHRFGVHFPEIAADSEFNLLAFALGGSLAALILLLLLVFGVVVYKRTPNNKLLDSPESSVMAQPRPYFWYRRPSLRQQEPFGGNPYDSYDRRLSLKHVSHMSSTAISRGT